MHFLFLLFRAFLAVIAVIYLIDAAFVINGIGFEPNKKYITTPKVIRELRDFKSNVLVTNAFSEEILVLREPSFESEKKVSSNSLSSRFSEADISLAALALDLVAEKTVFVVLSDDFSLQNFFKAHGINFDSVLREKIKHVRNTKK
jgi:rRNA maturation endonuclease Nob1